jgi:hypothetical protein
MNAKYAKMAGMEAVICVQQDVKLYQTNSGHTRPTDIGLEQYLSSASCFQNSTSTVMRFSRNFYISSSLSNSNTVNFTQGLYFLSASGSGPTLDYSHGETSYNYFSFQNDPLNDLKEVSMDSKTKIIIGVTTSVVLALCISGAIIWMRKKKLSKMTTLAL